jgi:hypothetical protein
MRTHVALPITLPAVLAAVLVPPSFAQWGSEQVVPVQSESLLRDLRLVDLDGDGDLDLLTSAGNSQIRWNENLGSGVFSPQKTVGNATFPTDLTSGDLDGDGDKDVLVTVQGGDFGTANDRVQWYPNLGGGVFGAAVVITNAPGWPQAVDAADLDGDGDLDIVVAPDLGTEMWLFEGIGLGGFAAHPDLPLSSGPEEVELFDLAGSSLPDMLIGTLSQVLWLENRGGGAFGPENVLTSQLSQGVDVHAADLDGDGDLDVLSASRGNDKISWFENLGGGAFGAEQVLTLQADGARCVDTGDLDGDGDLDVLSASGLDDKVAWYENLGGGAFGPQQLISIQADSPVAARSGDLDGDGDLEVVSNSSTDDELSWYENLHGTGISYCTAAANSTGLPAAIQASGSASASAGLLTLDIAPVPDENGLVFHAAGTAQTPFGNGTLCITGNIFRGALVVGVGHAASYAYDLSDVKHDLTGFVGTERHFQYWFRDTAAGGANFNLSDALVIPILP